MKILAIADQESKYYYDYYKPDCLNEFDLILSCGDLNANYLEFLATMAHCPVLYVCGNHDDGFELNPPEGCICIENQIYEYQGIRIIGLGGSYKYRDGKNMYTEKQMKRRIRRLHFQLCRKKGVDIVLTHAPAYGINDLNNRSHRGFECFLDLLKKYKPKFFIHGHVHMNYEHNMPRESVFYNTVVVNAYEYYKLSFPTESLVKKNEIKIEKIKF